MERTHAGTGRPSGIESKVEFPRRLNNSMNNVFGMGDYRDIHQVSDAILLSWETVGYADQILSFVLQGWEIVSSGEGDKLACILCCSLVMSVRPRANAARG